jgi:hypothetical protein
MGTVISRHLLLPTFASIRVRSRLMSVFVRVHSRFLFVVFNSSLPSVTPVLNYSCCTYSRSFASIRGCYSYSFASIRGSFLSSLTVLFRPSLQYSTTAAALIRVHSRPFAVVIRIRLRPFAVPFCRLWMPIWSSLLGTRYLAAFPGGWSWPRHSPGSLPKGEQ